jgi:hypothetical protein
MKYFQRKQFTSKLSQDGELKNVATHQKSLLPQKSYQFQDTENRNEIDTKEKEAKKIATWWAR